MYTVDMLSFHVLIPHLGIHRSFLPPSSKARTGCRREETQARHPRCDARGIYEWHSPSHHLSSCYYRL